MENDVSWGVKKSCSWRRKNKKKEEEKRKGRMKRIQP
jgi:hypothetical protein